MSLFKMPTRKEININQIVAKTQEYKKPKIQLHGTTLMARLQAIESNVNKNLSGYECLLLDSDEKWLAYCREACNKKYTALDTETTGLTFHDQGNLVGVCIQAEGMLPAYAPTGHISVVTELALPNQVSKEAVKEGFEILLSGSTKYIFHNAYYDLVVLYLATGLWIPVEADTNLIAFSLNENEPHGLKYLYDKYVMGGSAGVHKFAELFDGIPACYVPPKVFMKYSAHDSEMTLALFKWYLPYITKGTAECTEGDLEGVSDILYNVEFPLVKVLAEMKVDGIDIDFDKASELKEKYEKLKAQALEDFNKAVSVYEDDIKEYNAMNPKKRVDYPINYNSPAQIKALFYDIIKTGVIFKKEPTGTGSHVLDELLTNEKYKGKPIFTIAKTLQSVKKYDKLIGSFIDKLPKEASEYGGVIHGSFKSCGARTSRMSSSEPNLQQIPSKYKDIRNMFIPGKGRMFVGSDYSQQEMMCMASLADDEKMLQSFDLGRDIYSHIASIAFNLPYEECCEFNADGSTHKEGKTRRKKAKAIALGIAYGKGVKAISEDIHVDMDKAQEIKDSILKAFPQLAEYLKNVVVFGKEHGYVKDFYGRKRRLPMLTKPDYEFKFPQNLNQQTVDYYTKVYTGRLDSVWKASDSEDIIREAKSHGIIIKDNRSKKAKEVRESYNAPIQSSAALLTKLAILNMYNNERLRELGAKLKLLIHDEVVLSVPTENVYEASKIIEKCAVDAGKGLKAKLRCDVAISDSWEGTSYGFDDNKNLVEIKEEDD